MAEEFKWGIIGPGHIAASFAEGLAAAEGCTLYGAASRTPGRAQKFIKTWGGEKAYTSYEALLEDREVDAVYISTPNNLHLENAKAALKAGKPVLCEKPLTLNEAQTRELIDTAREEKVYLMEAMWARFFPLMDKIRSLIAEGAIGDIRMVQADFGFRRPEASPDGRVFNLKLGGGSLLDVGVYPIAFFQMLLGDPDEVQGLAHVGETGVDEQCTFLLSYPEGRLAMGSSAIMTRTPWEARIMGTEGRIHIPLGWWRPSSISLWKDDREQVIEEPFRGNGYNFEAVAVMNDVRAGRLENEMMPLKDSLSITKTMDRLRKLWGVTYPED